MTIKPWKEISRETVFQKYGRKLDKVIFKLPNGIESDFYLTGDKTKLVCVLALTKKKEVILATQFRPGPQIVVSELPGGGVNKNESPLEAAKRELLEETGYAGDFTQTNETMTDAYSGAIRYHFVATNCQKTKEISYTETELTEIKLLNLSDFKKHLFKGQMSDYATALFGLNYLKLIK